MSHFAQAPYMPLTVIEDLMVFSYGGVSKNARIRMRYNPQGLMDCNKVCRGKGHSDHRPSKITQNDYMQTKTGHPNQLLEFKSDEAKQHPTQKPVALGQYLIKTYTNEDEIVLDFVMGSGTTALACTLLNRHFIGIEKEAEYVEIARKR